MKKIISVILALMTVLSVSSSLAPLQTFAEHGSDPADSYTVQRAPNEDSDIRMWFNHANVKVHQEDTTSTGRNTYSVYMAKNEYQGTQVTLYSPSVTKSLITAEIGTFTAMDSSGATMSADVYYEFYIDCQNLDTTDVLGVSNPSQSIIREGAIPDAMAKISEINSQAAKGKFTLTAGKTQTLYIKIKSELDTPSGWYSAQFNVKNTSGQVIKTATVYAYVWDFEIPEQTHLQTAVHLSYQEYGADSLYKNAYDYLLDNRICAFEIPGGLTSSNPNLSYYLTNPRVNAIAVANKTFKCQMTWTEIRDVYNMLSARDDWDEIKDKFYFYVVDEPRSQQVHDVTQSEYFYNMHPPIDEMFQMHARVELGWPNATCLTCIDDNQPYPPGYSKTLALVGNTYITKDDGVGRFNSVMDTTQGMMNEGSVDIWCMKTQVFTPNSILEAAGYHGLYRVNKVMDINGQCSGFDYGNLPALYFDWDSIYGDFKDRFAAFQSERAAAGDNKKLWVYMCGKGPDYTYCNNLIENTGLQTNLMFWQTMQNGATGFLYYAANLWESTDTSKIADGSSVAYDGSMASDIWTAGKWTPTGVYNPTTYPFGDPVSQGTVGYGNGILLYGKGVKVKLRIGNTTQPLGTVRVEHLRDGIEDYEMLWKYREAYGEAAMNTLISKVSSNVACYLSLPGFNRSAYPSSMTNEDIFASVRRELGDAVEAAFAAHEHVWDDGVETTPATCTATGVVTYTCTICGETYTEETGMIPHTWNAGVETLAPTYTAEGETTYTCTVCGATRTEAIPVLPASPGDVNGDGKINSRDLALFKRYLADSVGTTGVISVNCDVNGDGKVNSRDISAFKRMLSGS